MLKTVLFSQLQKGLNHLFSLDPDSKERLSALNHKTIKIHLQGLGWDCYLQGQEGILQVSATAPDTKIDTVIEGTPLRLLHLALTQDTSTLSQDIRIEGNLEVGQQVMELFDRLHIDKEEYVSRYLGDVSAHYLSQAIERLTGWSKDTGQRITEQVSEFVHEEAPWIPPTEALKDFYHDVDVLRMDVDRLEARVQQLLGQGEK